MNRVQGEMIQGIEGIQSGEKLREVNSDIPCLLGVHEGEGIAEGFLKLDHVTGESDGGDNPQQECFSPRQRISHIIPQ